MFCQTIEDSWKVVPTQWRWSLVNIYLYHGVIEALASLLLPFLAVTYFTLMTCIRLWQRKKNMATTFGTGMFALQTSQVSDFCTKHYFVLRWKPCHLRRCFEPSHQSKPQQRGFNARSS